MTKARESWLARNALRLLGTVLTVGVLLLSAGIYLQTTRSDVDNLAVRISRVEQHAEAVPVIAHRLGAVETNGEKQADLLRDLELAVQRLEAAAERLEAMSLSRSPP